MDNSHKTDEALPVQPISYLDVTFESPAERSYRLAIGWFAIVYACLMMINILTTFSIQLNLFPPRGRGVKFDLDAYQYFSLSCWFVIILILTWGSIRFLQMKKSGVILLRMACVIWIMYDIGNEIYEAYRYPQARELWMSISGFIDQFTTFLVVMTPLPIFMLLLLHPRAVMRFR